MARRAQRSSTLATEFLLGRHWAMHPDDLRALQVAIAAKLDAGLTIEAVESIRGQWIEGTWSGTIRDGVATIPVRGVLTRYVSWWSWYFGGTAYETIATDARAAFAKPEVTRLLLDVNTPGGEVDGADETAQLIRSMSEEFGKPVDAYIGGKGLSAGYWLSVAAQRIHVGPASMTGSIGTVLSCPDTRGFQKMIGIREREFVSSQSPRKRLDPNTPKGQSEIIAILDAMADVFIDRVADYRGTDRDTVLADYGQGGVFIGQAAVDAGLADSLTTYEALHQELAGREAPTTIPLTGATMKTKVTASASTAKAEDTAAPADTEKKKKEGEDEDENDEQASETLTAAEIVERFPEAAATLRLEGATAERARIAAIDKLAGEGREKIIAEAKADPTATAAGVALRIVSEVPNAVTPKKSAGAQHLEALDGDEAALEETGKPSAAGGQADTSGADAVVRRINATYDSHRVADKAAAARN